MLSSSPKPEVGHSIDSVPNPKSSLPRTKEASIVSETSNKIGRRRRLAIGMTYLSASNLGVTMAVSEILASIDREIAQLQKARAVLEGVSAPAAKKKAGRPRKAAAVVITAAAKPARKKKRNLSPEGRKRIAEAVKRRWAAQKKAAAAAAK